jgi:hypothetical protein
MAAQTLLQLRTRAIQRAAMDNNTAVSTTEWSSYVNSATAETYRALVRNWGFDRFESGVDYTINNDKACVPTVLTVIDPSGWLAILSVHLTFPNGASVPITSFFNVDRDRKWFGGYLWRRENIRYRVVGQAIEFEPVGKPQGWTGTIRYVPDYVAFASDAATFDGRVSGWDDRVILRAAQIARTKLRLDCSDLISEIGMMDAGLDVAGMTFQRGGAQKAPRRSRW